MFRKDSYGEGNKTRYRQRELQKNRFNFVLLPLWFEVQTGLYCG